MNRKKCLALLLALLLPATAVFGEATPSFENASNPFWVQPADPAYVALPYVPLVFSGAEGAVEGGAATYTLSADGKAVTFALQDNLRFMDGMAVTSDDFINALYLVLMPGYDGVFDLSGAGIEGVEAYASGEAASISGIVRVSDTAFTLRMASAEDAVLRMLEVPALRVSLFGSMRRPDTLTDPAGFEAFYAQSLEASRAADVTAMAYGQYTAIQPERVPTLEVDPINRDISRITARTLENLPEVARQRADSLVVGVPDLLGTFNPFWARTTGDDYAASLLFDELLFANNLGEIGAGAATYARSQEGRTITFTLQDNLRYADGAALVSDDFINALYLVLMPGFDGAYDLSGARIEGVEAYLSGTANAIAGIVRISDKSFSVTLDAANEADLIFFALPALRVSLFGQMCRPEALTDPTAFAAYYAQTLQRVRETDATQMAYGQYTHVSHTPGVQAVLAKHEGYWRGAPYIGTIELRVIESGEELEAIMSGEVDIVSMLGSIEAVDVVADMENGKSFINLYTWNGDVVGYLGMDLENPIFAETGVRQALAMGFDREAARKGRVERYGSVPNVLLFDSFDVSASKLMAEQYAYNPGKAASLLEAAGWMMGEDGLRHRGDATLAFTLTYNTPNPVMDVVVQQMQEDYAALGIALAAEQVSFEALLTRIDEGSCEMYFQARRLPSSAVLAAGLFVGDSHLNTSGYSGEMVERLLQMAQSAEDEARQNVIYEMLFQELYLDLPFIPLYRRSEFLLINARVMNVTVTTAHDILADAYRFFLTDTLEGQW